MKPSERILEIARDLVKLNYNRGYKRTVISEFDLIDHATMIYLDEVWKKTTHQNLLPPMMNNSTEKLPEIEFTGGALVKTKSGKPKKFRMKKLKD